MKRGRRHARVRYRYRPGGRRANPFPAARPGQPRRRVLAFLRSFLHGDRALQGALVLIAVFSLAMCALTAVRSARTAALNRSLSEMHSMEEFPVWEPEEPDQEQAASSSGGITLSRMSLPDGTAIRQAEVTQFHRDTGKILPDMVKLCRENKDTVGWISIPGIVSLPVVYRDNTYYLTHDFSNADNRSGTLFLDEHHSLEADPQNLLIYGHNMRDGSMFGLLTHYRDLATLREHPLIEFSTLWEKEEYAVFAVVLSSDDPGAAGHLDFYNHPSFTSEKAFNDYIARVRQLSLFDIPITVRPVDALITLSTCMDSGHLLVFARRLDSLENREETVAAVQKAKRRFIGV